MTAFNPADLSTALASLNAATGNQAQAALKLNGKAKTAAENFEATFLNSAFQEMFTGMDGDGPFGGSGALKVWRSLMTDQYARAFAKAGGIGIAAKVYDTLLKHQGQSGS
jgi:Rod binding domain-containing protein